MAGVNQGMQYQQNGTMQQPGMPYQQNGMQYQQPGMGMQQPGMGMQQPGMGVQQPGMQQPGMGMQQPGMQQQPGATLPADMTADLAAVQAAYDQRRLEPGFNEKKNKKMMKKQKQAQQKQDRFIKAFLQVQLACHTCLIQNRTNALVLGMRGCVSG